jgi:signal peptidase I
MRNYLRGNLRFIAFLVMLGFVRTAVADWNPIPSGSMRPTILEGDVVFVNRLAFDVKVPLTDVIVAHTGAPKRGDIVTFTRPEDGMRLIKRIAAVPGDTIAMRDNRLTINGEAIAYAPLGNAVETPSPGRFVDAEQVRETFGTDAHTIQWLSHVASRSTFAPMAIPADQYLMLGDNRDDSEDSRYFGLIPRERLIGRAERVLVSADIKDHWQLRLARFGSSLYP